MAMELLTQKVLNDFVYKDGALLDKEGFDKSTKTHQGYRQLYVAGKSYLLHRLVFLYHNGYFPKVVDHIDGNKENNKIENLQGCNQSVNIAKSKMFNTNKTGFRGVHYNIKAKKYEAYFFRDYKKIYCGLFDTAEEAFAERQKKKYDNQ